jgi:tyrosyl-tRNA synthetase
VPEPIIHTDNEALAAQANDPTFDSLWDELTWRGLVHVSTDADRLRALLAGSPISFYCGFDPTAPSLHLGNLVQLITMRRLQLAGHRPLGLVGGSTGLIGDPRPSAERVLNTKDTVAEWVGYLHAQISRFLQTDGANGLVMVNNLDWTAPLSAIDFLRDIGKHFRVGTMLKKDAVSARLNSTEGISFTEFSYQILQGMDFLQLFKEHGCVLQTGGSDQWGNLTSGIDLIHRVEGVSAHAIGTPLITTADGKKFGKSEGNAVWLDPAMTSPYAFYQFWLNTDDADVVTLLKIFTFLSRSEVERVASLIDSEPHRREGQRMLAAEVTTLVHGADATARVIAASDALFGRGDLARLDAGTLRAAAESLPHIAGRRGVGVAQLLVDTGVTTSLGESRRAIEQGGVSVNNAKLTHDVTLGQSDFLAGEVAILRRGKRTLAAVLWQPEG